MKQKAIIFDIDGTIAIRDKEPGGRGPFDWDRVGEDTPNEPVMFVAKMLAFAATVAGDINIVFFSGRDERAKYPTEEWLEEHFRYSYHLMMRSEGDNRPDYVVKREMLNRAQLIYDIVAVFDDRNQVVDMWRDNDITCFQVCSREDGDF